VRNNQDGSFVTGVPAEAKLKTIIIIIIITDLSSLIDLSSLLLLLLRRNWLK